MQQRKVVHNESREGLSTQQKKRNLLQMFAPKKILGGKVHSRETENRAPPEHENTHAHTNNTHTKRLTQ